MCKKIIILLLSGLLLSGCGKEQNETVLVGAAASLTNPLNEIGTLYMEHYSDAEIVFTYGGSGTLAKQIEEGATIDLFLPADSLYLEQLEVEGIVENGSETILTNELVLVTNKESGLDNITFQQLITKNEWSLAIGDPATVPVGRYAMEVLGEQFLENEMTLNLGTDVRQVLTWVEEGVVELGIVYLSDALSSNEVEILDCASEKSHNPISYPLVIVDDKEEVINFAEFLASEEALTVFEQHGFKRSE